MRIVTTARQTHKLELEALFELSVMDTFKREGIIESHAEGMHDEVRQQKTNLTLYLDESEPNEVLFVATENTRIVGVMAYGGVTPLVSETLMGAMVVPRFEVKSAYVLPTYQAKGVGACLFAAVIQALEKRGETQACLDCGYRLSQSFWVKQVGQPTVIKRDFFGKGGDYMVWCFGLASARR